MNKLPIIHSESSGSPRSGPPPRHLSACWYLSKGLSASLYTDRGSHYFFTPKAGEAVDKDRLTQVGRALKQLGIEHIPAYSPEARGRSERMFATLQDRLSRLVTLR